MRVAVTAAAFLVLILDVLAGGHVGVKAREYELKKGAIKGGGINDGVMTMEEAQKACDSHAGCNSFTFRHETGDIGPDQSIKVYFSKSEEIDEGASGWYTYRIKDAEVDSVKDGYIYVPGSIGINNDLSKRDMSWDEAKKTCDDDRACLGFSFSTDPDGKSPEGEISSVRFVSDLYQVDRTDSSTHSWVKQDPSNFDKVMQLVPETMHAVLRHKDIVLVNFYVDWCRYCRQLAPIWDQTWVTFDKSWDSAVTRVDCVAQAELCEEFMVSKYPTIKAFRRAAPLRSEYRGQRSPQAFQGFVQSLLGEAVPVLSDNTAIETHMVKKKRAIIGEFNSEDHPDASVFRGIGDSMRDECSFVMRVDPSLPSDCRYLYRSPHHDDEIFDGDTSDASALKDWALESCNPLVRELTFDNAEELTELGLPFLILFHAPDESESVRKFAKAVKERLSDRRDQLIFVTADGHQFSHPLRHLGKKKTDLPVLALDTFKHMYPFKHFEKIDDIGVLEHFVGDLFSGLLHWRFHHGGFENDDDEYKTGKTAATLYEGNDFDGKWYAEFPIGEYNVASLMTQGGRNDEASSLKVSQHCTATLYEHGEWNGWEVKFSAGEYTLNELLEGGAKDNDLSSLKVGCEPEFQPIPEKKEEKEDAKREAGSSATVDPSPNEEKAQPGSQNHDDHDHDIPDKPTPVKSVMTKLKPSRHRYSFADNHDEL